MDVPDFRIEISLKQLPCKAKSLMAAREVLTAAFMLSSCHSSCVWGPQARVVTSQCDGRKHHLCFSSCLGQIKQKPPLSLYLCVSVRRLNTERANHDCSLNIVTRVVNLLPETPLRWLYKHTASRCRRAQ